MKVFFADLDGTLLNDEKVITDKTMAALLTFIGKGGRFAICTGRPVNSAMHIFEALNMPPKGSYIIAYNGAQIYDCERRRTVFRAEVPFDLTAPIFELAKFYDIHCQTYTDTHIVSKTENECVKYYRQNIHMPLIVTDNILESLSVPPCKVMAIELHDHRKLEDFRLALERELGGRLKFQYSNQNYLEMFSADADKGAAVHKLCDIMGISYKDSIAAGDEQNDIPMIKAAGIGIAMCNGSREVKLAADVITQEDNNHDGLVPFLTI